MVARSTSLVLMRNECFVHAHRETSGIGGEQALVVAAADEVAEFAAQGALGAGRGAGIEFLGLGAGISGDGELGVRQIADVAQRAGLDDGFGDEFQVSKRRKASGKSTPATTTPWFSSITQSWPGGEDLGDPLA